MVGRELAEPVLRYLDVEDFTRPVCFEPEAAFDDVAVPVAGFEESRVAARELEFGPPSLDDAPEAIVDSVDRRAVVGIRVFGLVVEDEVLTSLVSDVFDRREPVALADIAGVALAADVLEDSRDSFSALLSLFQ